MCVCVCVCALLVLILFSHVWLLSLLSCIRLFATPWTVACQASLSMGVPRQEYQSGLPCPPPGDLPDPGIKPTVSPESSAFQADSLPSEPSGKPQNILRPSVLYIMRLLIFVFRTFTDYVIIDIFGSIHSSTLAWKIPWTEEPGSLQSIGSLGVGHDWATSLSLFTLMHWRRKWQPTPVFLPGESQGRGSLVGCHLWGLTESDTTEVT